MLTLARKAGEAIQIGDDVLLVVKSVGKRTVKLGFIAPDHVRIHRREIIIKQEREAAQERAEAHKSSSQGG